MADWDRKPFAALLKEPVRNGIYKTKEFHGRGCKIVNMGELFAHSRMYSVPMKRVDLNESEQRRFLLEAGDLIFARRSLTAEGAGKCSVVLEVTEPTTFESSIIRARPNPDLANSEFLFYFFSSLQGYQALDTIRRQVAVAGITGGDLSQLSIPVPPVPIQNSIAHTLSLFDRKIELNRQTNETLEGMAQAIFRDWFVDFGPVRRAHAGATDPVAIMGGLTPDPARASHLAALFPAAIGNDGLPVGWSEGSLARLALINSESWKASNHPAEVEYVDLSNTKWGTIEATARLTWEAAPSRARRVAKKGDSIIGTVRPGNGSYAYIGRDGYTVSTGFAVLRPKQAIYTDAIYVAATAADNITRLANLADGHGGAYPAVNPDVVAATPFPVVPDALLTAFSTFASPLREKIEQAKLENTTLAETRDYLLPRLMSGAVRVAPQVEAI